ncbi:RNA-binding protein, putative, partial [Ixodes scapularis]
KHAYHLYPTPHRDRRSERSRGRERDYRGSDRDRDRGDRMERGVDRSMDRGPDRGPDHRGGDRGSDRGRDRDRDRDRDFLDARDWDRDRDRDRDWDRGDRDRSRDHSWERNMRDRGGERREEIPNNTIMVRGMPIETTEPELRNEVTRYGLEPKDIRLMKRKDTGASRGFAFVEFRYLSEAVRWKELTKGVVQMGDVRCSLHYSIPKDGGPCGVNNFRRRDNCFKCSAAREGTSDAEIPNSGDGFDEISSVPTNTLLLRNLDVLTTEERVLAVLGQTTNVPIKSLKVARDPATGTSRGFCYVELHTVAEAAQLDDLLLNLGGQFYVDGRQGECFCCGSVEGTGQWTLSPFPCSGNTASVASVALAAAQWTNQISKCAGIYAANADILIILQKHSYGNLFDTSLVSFCTTCAFTAIFRSRRGGGGTLLEGECPLRKVHGDQSWLPVTSQTVSSLGTVLVDGVNYPRYPVPDVSTYRYDDKSGYYYDASTGLYYDANSHYYYNAEAQQYMYWNNDKQTYLPAPTSSSTAEQVAQAAANTGGDGTDAEKGKGGKKEGKEDKVKIAKKIAKDMERWAKTLNQKKENAKQGLVASQPTGDERQSAAADAGFAVLEKHHTAPERIAFGAMGPRESVLVPEYGAGSDSDSEAESGGVDESRLVDWAKLACLLCKRQFPSREVLTKHTQLSDLHKQNLEALRLSRSTGGPDSQGSYRDRARERRIKYGQPEPPQTGTVHKEKVARPMPAQQNYEEPTKAGIGEDNIGNKMLKAMGWSEGQGLGKSNTGTTNIVEVQRRVTSAGLGVRGATYGATAANTYKESVKKAMAARYHELS